MFFVKMKIDKNGRLKHEDYYSSFNYRGRLFVIDKFDDFWLITESQFLVKERGKTLNEATIKIKKTWDSIHHKFKDF